MDLERLKLTKTVKSKKSRDKVCQVVKYCSLGIAVLLFYYNYFFRGFLPIIIPINVHKCQFKFLNTGYEVLLGPLHDLVT